MNGSPIDYVLLELLTALLAEFFKGNFPGPVALRAIILKHKLDDQVIAQSGVLFGAIRTDGVLFKDEIVLMADKSSVKSDPAYERISQSPSMFK